MKPCTHTRTTNYYQFSYSILVGLDVAILLYTFTVDQDFGWGGSVTHSGTPDMSEEQATCVFVS